MPEGQSRKITSPPDLDNLGKFVLDALQKGGILEDDSQVTKLLLEKRLAPKPSLPSFPYPGSTSLSISKRAIEIDD